MKDHTKQHSKNLKISGRLTKSEASQLSTIIVMQDKKKREKKHTRSGQLVQ